MTTWDRGAIAFILALLLVLWLSGTAHAGFIFSGGCRGWDAYAYNAAVHRVETYIMAHGYWGGFYKECTARTFFPASNMPRSAFAFFAVCDGMNVTVKGTLAKTATESIGYYDMSRRPTCDACWNKSLVWQDTLFRLHGQGMSWKAAYDRSLQQYPECKPCTAYHGQSLVTRIN